MVTAPSWLNTWLAASPRATNLPALSSPPGIREILAGWLPGLAPPPSGLLAEAR